MINEVRFKKYNKTNTDEYINSQDPKIEKSKILSAEKKELIEKTNNLFKKLTNHVRNLGDGFIVKLFLYLR